ncbi:hypothetical protein T06_16349 [Trichinella sp. T6]|nr:hypothetical protein T06_16349 [Trichinella sp. T6]
MKVSLLSLLSIQQVGMDIGLVYFVRVGFFSRQLEFRMSMNCHYTQLSLYGLYANLLYYYCFVEIRSTGAEDVLLEQLKPCLCACCPQNLDDKFCNGTIAERILCQRRKNEHHMLLLVEENDEVKRSFHSDTKLCSTSGQRAVLASQSASCALWCWPPFGRREKSNFKNQMTAWRALMDDNLAKFSASD